MQIVLSRPGKRLREHQAQENDPFRLSPLGLWEAVSALGNVKNVSKGHRNQASGCPSHSPVTITEDSPPKLLRPGGLEPKELTCPNVSLGHKKRDLVPTHLALL